MPRIIRIERILADLHAQLAEISSMYYEEELTQSAIAERVGLSRVKIYRLLKQAKEEQIVEIAINWPIQRLVISILANLYASWVTGAPVHDLTSGFKCYRRDILSAIDLDRIRSNGYAFQIEMSFKAWKKGFRLFEIPIVFLDRRSGNSKMSRAITYEAFFMLWKLRLQSLFNRL